MIERRDFLRTAARGAAGVLIACWHNSNAWAWQMELARKVGAGVGVSSGWRERLGLAQLPDASGGD